MDGPVAIVPAHPAPPYVVALFASFQTSDPYEYLSTLLSAPTSHLILTPPIRLPRSLYDKHSVIPEIKATVLHINFEDDIIFIGLHPSTKYALCRAYESFLNSYPNRCVPHEIKETWRTRFWQNMDWVQWVVPAELLCWIDERSGTCDLAWFGMLDGGGYYKLPCGVPEMLASVEAKIKRLFLPTLEEERSIWEIPYQIQEATKSRFRIEEEDRVYEGGETIETELLWNNASWSQQDMIYDDIVVDPSKIGTNSAKRKRKRKRVPSVDLDIEPTLPCPRVRIYETETGGKSVAGRVRRVVAPLISSNIRLLTTAEGRSYIETVPQTPTIRRRLPLPPPPPLPPPAEAQTQNQAQTQPSQPLLPPPAAPTPHHPQAQSQPQSYLSRPPGSYPTPPADNNFFQQPQPSAERILEPLINVDRPSPLELPSPLLSGEDYECRDSHQEKVTAES
ncbi:hypothetical protein BZA05DRAFT_444465 [Tricharina praecox]|uniref:uncharacterized protein n=1 Tax=Tricharina praecox TaxID=43433 RepID=UPI00221E78A5|nr:uncharacterized protein BZA05DRAFT_444465 [Tricharina praecox]KAI5853453.1 hypothetical protein BZA05DRAFT_444465 [Tricharina praecox]